MTYHHNLSKKQKTRHSNNSSNSSSSSDRDDRSLDHSLIGESLNLSQKNVAQIAFAFTNGTQEVRDLLLNECNIIYECRLCKNMFRSFANLVAHKRIYCKDHQCEQMMLYEPSWFIPEQEKNDIKVEVTPEEPIRNQKISFPPKLDSKTLELKRKSLHSIANSLQNKTQIDDSDTKPISTSQFYSSKTKQKEFTNTNKTRKNATKFQQLTQQSLNKQADSLAQTSIEVSTLKTETLNQEETILSTKSSTEDVIINPSILNESSPMTRDHSEVKILNIPINENSLSSSSCKTTTSVSPTPIKVCKKNKHRPNRNSILKLESPNAYVKKSPQFSEMKPQTLKTVKPVWSGNSNAYGSLLNRHYHNDHHQSILSKEPSSVASSSSSSLSSTLNNSNVHECSEQVCTKIQTKSDEHNNQCNDDHERPANKLRIPIEVITIDSDNEAYSDEIYAL